MRRTFLGCITLPAVGLAILALGLPAGADLPANATRQAGGGGVTVIATPLPEQGDATRIKLVLDTHSANLDAYRFESIATLRDESGRQYPLQAVERASGGGHHREAILRFARVSPQAKTVELVVEGVAGVPERVLQWTTE